MSTFTISATDGQARTGLLKTRHGTVQTPAFLPCATHGALRGVGQRSLRELGYEVLLANAYHLYLRPGIETIEQLGGLHQFMQWTGTILTDSGGFQAFALPQFVRYESDGIRFRSHIDGSEHFFTPQLVVDSQQRLGVDIATCLDVCTGFPVPESEVAAAVDQTNRWAETSIAAWTDRAMLLYGMVQGSIYPEQRRRSAEFLRELSFSGYAIGGNMYTFGKSIAELAHEKPAMWETVAYTTSMLPNDKPRHLLGVGEPSDIIAGVAAGIDTFDCVMPTRMARHGSAWIRLSDQIGEYERIDLAAARYTHSAEPLDTRCQCPACQQGYSRGYLHHLARVHDPVLGTLLSIHNLAYLQELVHTIQTSLAAGQFHQQFSQI